MPSAFGSNLKPLGKLLIAPLPRSGCNVAPDRGRACAIENLAANGGSKVCFDEIQLDEGYI
jgi:hypothetical protein